MCRAKTVLTLVDEPRWLDSTAGGARQLLAREADAPDEDKPKHMDRLRAAEKNVLVGETSACPYTLSSLLQAWSPNDFPVSKYLYRTEEDPPDKAYKEYMERTKDRRARLQKVGGAGLAAFLKKDQQVNE
eukprot:1194397-Prorocentrum_minimum.AAC.8